ncbi:hypothetical protein MLD38_021404 [Melastoma candidum]|uniref:Uncharacterized protein n=1 Tax=Melastoma candidum TaxID=119954 RepID=A0ACB9QJD8_9MYRT|nr:hypothetical protein MLD38_021404 [Melastoma candidum]
MEDGAIHGKEVTDDIPCHEDDDPPTLSSHALAALQEFLLEQEENTRPEDRHDDEGNDEVALVTEDWRLSQFWYDRQTAETVAREVLTLVSGSARGSTVACIACPTLYAYLKKLDPDAAAKLLEYDKRFEQYGSDFVYYNYNNPDGLPPELKHSFQVIVADPPYLSQECLEKVAEAMSFLAESQTCRFLLLTGEVQKDQAAQLLGMRPCVFRPKHSSKLGNEFRLFTNYNPGMRLGGWELEK